MRHHQRDSYCTGSIPLAVEYDTQQGQYLTIRAHLHCHSIALTRPGHEIGICETTCIACFLLIQLFQDTAGRVCLVSSTSSCVCCGRLFLHVTVHSPLYRVCDRSDLTGSLSSIVKFLLSLHMQTGHEDPLHTSLTRTLGAVTKPSKLLCSHKMQRQSLGEGIVQWCFASSLLPLLQHQ